MIEFIPVIMILVSIPFFCWSDWKFRTVPIAWMGLLYLVNVPALVSYLAESPARNYYLLGLSACLCIVALVLAFAKAIGGADFWFVSCILIFVQYNPFKFPRVSFPVDFIWTLLLTACYLPVLVFFYNKWKGNDLPIMQMFFQYPRGFPFIFPISFAFIVTLAIELLI